MFDKKRSYCLEKFRIPTSLSSERIINGSTTQLADSKAHRIESWCREINYKPFLSFIYTVLCSVFIIASSTLVKKLSYIDSGQLSMIRNLGVLFGNLPISLYCVKDILGPKKYRWLLVIRALLGATALYLNLLAYRLLPLAEASIILSTVPAVVSITARIFLKERFGLIQGCAVMFTVAGMLLSIRLPELIRAKGDLSTTDYTMGLASALGCVVILSITLVSIRKMQDVHFSVLLLYLGVLGSVENAMLTGFLSTFTLPRCGWDQVQVVLIGVFGFLGHNFLTMAVQMEAVGIVSVVKASMDIIVALVMQVLFFDLIPDMYNIGGALLVMVSVSIIGLRKWLTTLPEDHIKRKKWKYLLL